MNTSVELALCSAFAPLSAAVDVIPQTGGVIPDNKQFISVECSAVRNVGGPLRDFDLSIKVWTPQLEVAGLTNETHLSAVATAESFISSLNLVALDTRLRAVAGVTLQGWYFEESVNEHQDGRWHTSINYIIAIAKL